jgi:hypothetical protein
MRVALRATRQNREETRVRIAGFEQSGPYALLTVESLEVQEEGPYLFDILVEGGNWPGRSSSRSRVSRQPRPQSTDQPLV